MSLLEFFRPQKKTSANLAKSACRLLLRSVAVRAILRHPTCRNSKKTFKVIAKYVAVDPSMVDLSFEHKDDDISVLELNVKLPEDEK